MMNMRHVVAAIALAAVGACGSAESFGQADPYWLKSWNEAQKTRPAILTSSARIAPPGEPGMPFVLRGQVVEPDGRTPAAGVILHSYHRDQKGFDFGPNDNTTPTWRLQGWTSTDQDGRFAFQTIRPAPDHFGREAAHIHLTLESMKFGRQWAQTIFLSDDPLVTQDQRRRSAEAGAFGFVREVKIVDGVQQVSARVRLKGKADF